MIAGIAGASGLKAAAKLFGIGLFVAPVPVASDNAAHAAQGIRKPKTFWSGREDLNLRPPAPKAGALPGCATPRQSEAGLFIVTGIGRFGQQQFPL